MSEAADERLRLWQRMGGSGRWGIGVAVDIEAIEARLAALESSRSVQIAPETAAEGAKDPERDNTPAITDEEREAIEAIGVVADWADEHLGQDDPGVVALRALMKRLH